MKTSTYALAIALAGIATSVPAEAQYSGRQEQPAIRAQSGSDIKKDETLPQGIPGSGPMSTTGRKLDISKGAQKAILELQNAVNANDVANIPAKLAAAKAVAKTNDDKFVIASNQTKAALAANDLAGINVGIEAMQASGSADSADIALRFADLGKRYQKAQQVAQAAVAYERALSIDPNSPSALSLLAGIRDTQGRKADAVALMQKSFAASKARGQKVAEGNYKFAARLAYDARSPLAADITREWVTDYPTSTNWRDALRIYRDINGLQGDMKIDTLRLARAANSLAGEADYYGLASELAAKGYVAEAKAVIAEGGAKQAIDLRKPAFTQLSAKVAKAPTRAAVDASAKAAIAGGSGKAAMNAGDALYGFGAYAEAATAFKAALGRPGVDASLANLRLGMALARAGDKAGATAALNAVTGPQAGIAKYWLIWLRAQA
jgi:tetratricopeptide (TPR) repeat protein